MNSVDAKAKTLKSIERITSERISELEQNINKAAGQGRWQAALLIDDSEYEKPWFRPVVFKGPAREIADWAETRGYHLSVEYTGCFGTPCLVAQWGP